MTSNTIRKTARQMPGVNPAAKSAFGARTPLAEQIDFQRALHDDYDLRSCPIQASVSSPLRISEEHFDHQLF